MRAVYLGLAILLSGTPFWGENPFPWLPATAKATWLSGHTGLRISLPENEGNWILTVLDEKEFAARISVVSPRGERRTEGPFAEVSTPEFFGAFLLLENDFHGRNRRALLKPVSVKKTAEIKGNFSMPVGRCRTRSWDFWLIQWHMGGCGLAWELNPSILLGIHRESGRWAIAASYGQGFLDTRIGEEDCAQFDFLSAKRTSNNSWEIESWQFDFDGEKVDFSKGRSRFRWFGSELIADSPREARHWAHQEVAWHVSSSGLDGGIAEAFAPSPRSADRFEGILPQNRKLPFKWRSLIVACGKGGQRRFLDAKQAHQLASQGGWDVVLERRNGRPTATWLVEHEKDFPHSTPPRP